MSGNLLQMFPKERRLFWKTAAGDEEVLQEIRLRAGKPIIIKGRKGEWFLNGCGHYIKEEGLAHLASEQELTGILQHICQYSLYAYEDELRQGFITVTGGHRIGIAGQVVLDGDKVRTMKHISCMNIRIAHQIRGVADKILPRIYRNGRLLNTLIISPPGCGKTTLLRDLIRQVSDGNRYAKGLSVGMVDERSEIAGCCHGIPQNDVGIRTDVLDGCPKALGMMMLLRSMAPEVIAVDEIGSDQDSRALHMASRCGCKILATIHGESVQDVVCREGMGQLFEEKLFECLLILGKNEEGFTINVEDRGMKNA